MNYPMSYVRFFISLLFCLAGLAASCGSDSGNSSEQKPPEDTVEIDETASGDVSDADVDTAPADGALLDSDGLIEADTGEITERDSGNAETESRQCLESPPRCETDADCQGPDICALCLCFPPFEVTAQVEGGGEVTETMQFEAEAAVGGREPEVPVKYTWDFGDGEIATGPQAEHVYRQGGTFTVTVTAMLMFELKERWGDVERTDFPESIWRATDSLQLEIEGYAEDSCRNSDDCADEPGAACRAPGEFLGCGAPPRPPDNPCQTNADCGDDEVCIDAPPEKCYQSGSKICVPACESGACDAGQICTQQGMCSPRPCESHEDCPTDHFLCGDGGTCRRQPCSSGGDCIDGGFCVEQRCYNSLGQCTALPM